MPKSTKEFTKITGLIKLIINAYPGNWAILREYLQNADDSGATEQIFILDERSHPNGSLVDPVLKGAQGPALIAMNNGIITDRDWEALLKINSSSKQEDETQTGKNGLGFRASYHLTENPHILSGRTLMILDPHNEFTAHPGGVSIDLIDEGEQYKDQLLPFTSCIEGMTFPYDGTVFRLPLRTEEQAQKSDIKPTPTSVDDILEVLVEFSTRELEEAILFLKHIRSIQIFHVNSSGNKFCLAEVTIDPPCPPTLIHRTTVTSSNGKVTSRDWKFLYFSQTKSVAKDLMETRLNYNIGNRLTQDKLSPTVDIAFPLDGSSVRGRLFTLLPLPQYTDFPIHLNAVFALDPSRQNLKNILEIGAANSRERLLVEWNKIIFDTWTPTIWVKLLADLSDEVLISTSWNLWPPQENGAECYWSGLTAAFTNGVVSRYLRVFSTVPGNTAISRLVRITDPDVLLASSNPQISLTLLSDLGLSIVQPPHHIYAALLAGNHAVTLSPETLHRVLLPKARSEYEGYRDSDLKTVMDYLVFSSGSTKLKNIAGLPWVRRAKDNRRESLDLAGSGGIKLIPQTEVEVTIFFENTAMLAWDALSERLRAELSQHAAPGVLNVGTVNPTNIVSFLKHRLGNLQSTSDEILNVPSECDYLIAFWTWIVGWSKGDVFFQSHLAEVSSLFLLPTSRRSLRRLSSGIIHFGASETQFVDAWETLKIYSIASDVPHNVISKLRAAKVIPVPRSWTQILFLINNADIRVASSSKSEDIRRYLSENLPAPGPRFTAEQKAKFKRFPIFMAKDAQTGISSLRMIDGHCLYVEVEAGSPLPRLQGYPNAIYVDVKDSKTLLFARLVENDVRIQNRFSLLQLAIDNWDVQADGDQDKFIDRIFQHRPHQLPSSLRESLANLEFVVVNDSSERRKPRDLIHPASSLKDLYLGEVGRMPAGRFRDTKLLAVMQEFGFLRSSLDAYVVRDRISYIINPLNASDGRLIRKAGALVDLLNHEWKPDCARIVEEYRSGKWIPHDEPTSLLVSPSESRDNYRDNHNHPYFFDMVLTRLAATFRPEFRAALGWSTMIPSEILIAQLTETLDNPANRIKRLTKLLTYFNRLLSSNDLNSSALQKLETAVNGRAWIPSNSSSEHLMETRHALLMGPSRLNDPFYLVHIELLNSLPILRSLGCSDRPPLDLLVAELNKQYNDKSSSRTTSMSLKIEPVLTILQEIVDRHHDHLLDSGINIPGNDGHGHPLSDVYLSDGAVPLNLPASLQGKFAAHNGISTSLAQSLGIPPLSSLILGDDPEEDDDEQMDIDLVTAIRQFLSDYDPQYALNEFLANANDARATTFSILLDKGRESPVGGLIKPNFKALFSCETLFLHNDSKLNEDDLHGIRRVGRGGKLGDVDTHGRHGLGALSLYYFTDVATIISGEFVLILDPSSKYLPPFSNGRKRTAHLKKISEIVSQFPSQLERCESKFGFSSKNPTYDGTIFCLPLKASITEKACNPIKTMDHLQDSYRQLASRALLFINLKRITANQLVGGNQSTIWSFSAQRSPDRDLGPQFGYHTLTISEEETKAVSTWIVATSQTGVIPENFLKVAQVLKLTQGAKVQLAINSQDVENNVFQGYPFSTVSLPRGMSLPFHINARFAISSNRQDLVLNPGDSSGNNDAHTSLNTWILETLVPPLYLEALCLIISQSARPRQEATGRLKSKNWFFSQCSDVASKIIRSAFFQALPGSDHTIFMDVSGRLVSFSEAVFSKGEPKEVMEYLTRIKMPTYVKSRQYSDIAKIDGSTLVGPSFVREILDTNSDALLPSLSLTPEICFPIFNYLAQESTLTGLPLLVLQSKEVILVPNASGTPVYHCKTPGHARLFSSSQFMNVGSYSQTLVARLLSDPSINVTSLVQENVVHLIAAELQTGSQKHRMGWAHDFWKQYHETLPGPPSIASLESAGLLLIEATQGASSSLLPLNECRPDTVVYNMGLEDGVIDILHTLRIETITDEGNRLLKAFLYNRFKQDVLSNVLRCIDAKGIDILNSLNVRSMNTLSDWIQARIRSALDLWTRDASSMPLNKSILMRFTIWEFYSNGSLRRGNAMNLSVLPSHLQIQDIVPYLKPNITVAPWSSLLIRFLELCSSRIKSSIIFTPREILSIVELPATVTSRSEIANLKTFLTSMFRYSDQALEPCSWLVPDSDGTLRPVENLYDDSIGLFRSTLRFTQRPSFLHDDFKCFISQLRRLGLIHEITIDTFIHCANAVSEAYRTRSEMWNIVRQMSQDAFSIYQSQIPALTLLRRRYSAWSSLDCISFVLRKTERRQGATYHIRDNYVAGPLPSILPPSSFVLPAYEAVAWTQRALFLTEPIDGLITVNKTLGIPTAEEVVAHLVLLTTVIAIEHPGDSTLLSDIQATYAWLNENAASAGSYLRQSETKKLFLNVEDPKDESWSGSWASAEELVLNLEYDQGPLKIVKGFLKKYEALLRAAGSSDIKTSVPQAISTPSDTSSALARKIELDRMRKANELTDIELVPTLELVPTGGTDDTDASTLQTLVDDDIAFTPISPSVRSEVNDKFNMYSYAGGTKRIERMDLRAHRVIMASAIAHLRGLQLWKQKIQPNGLDEITFYGSAFAAKAILDFVYTGEIELSATTTDKTELSHLMHDLLEVLPVAEEWGMQDLKQKIQSEIVSKHEIVRRLPNEYDILLSYATKYSADQLLAALKELEPIRARIQRLMESEKR